ncbi:MAG: T9SS type A sorting domain-containing protein, partial [Bacteroidales bacterium]|nr:T9SS type A sorting domain-containing protein [Bacteroidales bacterium]
LPTVSLPTKTIDGQGTGKFTSIVENLVPDIVYYIRAYAINSTETAYGEEIQFSFSTPLATTGGTSSLTTSSVTLHGTANANNSISTVYIEYGTTTGYGNIIPAIPYEISGNSNIEVTADISGLEVYTEYHYRLIVNRDDCFVYGEDSVFTTYAEIEITKPEGAEEWFIGRAYNIEWENNGDPLVTLEYNTEDKPNWNLIANNVAIAEGYYNWIIPDSMTTNCKVRMTDGGEYIYDVSEAFEIFNPVEYSGINFVIGGPDENPENAFEEGEKVRFKVEVLNNLNFNLLTITGTIKSDCPWFTIIDDSATYNNVYANSTRESWDYYEIQLANELPDYYEIYFDLTIYDEFIFEDPFTSYSDTLIAIDPFEFSMVMIDDDEFPDSKGNNDGIVNPTEDIEIVPFINNIMKYNFTGVNGKLLCEHSGVEVWAPEEDECDPPDCAAKCGILCDVRDNYSYGYIDTIFTFTYGIPGYMINAMPDLDYVFTFNGQQQTSIEFSIVITGTPDSITLVPGLDKWSVSFTINNGYPPYFPEVWPGDVNNDMQVDNRDFLPLGVHFGEKGIPRDSTSILWMGHSSSDWNRLQYNLMNLKFADCNGDSVIEYLDTMAVYQNYGLSHIKSTPGFKSIESGPELHFVVKEESNPANELKKIEVWTGNLFIPVYDLYGIAFEIKADLSQIDPNSLVVSTSDTWLEGSGADLLTFAIADQGSGSIECAVVRTDQTGKDGFGRVAEISYKLKTGSVSTGTPFEITGYEAVNPDGIPIYFKVNNNAGKFPFDEGEGIISIFPNPSKGVFNVVVSNSGGTNELSVFNSQGNMVYKKTFINENQMGVFTIDLSPFDKGIYFLKLLSDDQLQMKKLIYN